MSQYPDELVNAILAEYQTAQQNGTVGMPEFKHNYSSGSHTTAAQRTNVAAETANTDSLLENWRYQRELADQRQLIQEQRDYDSPAAHAQRLRNAGINPDLYFMNGGALQSSVPGSAPASASPAAPSVVDPQMNAMSAIDAVASLGAAAAGIYGIYSGSKTLASTLATQVLQRQDLAYSAALKELDLVKGILGEGDIDFAALDKYPLSDSTKSLFSALRDGATSAQGLSDVNQFKLSSSEFAELFKKDFAAKSASARLAIAERDEILAKHACVMASFAQAEEVDKQTMRLLDIEAKSLANQFSQGSIDLQTYEKARQPLINRQVELQTSQMEYEMGYFDSLIDRGKSSDPIIRSQAQAEFAQYMKDHADRIIIAEQLENESEAESIRRTVAERLNTIMDTASKEQDMEISFDQNVRDQQMHNVQLPLVRSQTWFYRMQSVSNILGSVGKFLGL